MRLTFSLKFLSLTLALIAIISFFLGYYFNENSAGAGTYEGDIEFFWKNMQIYLNNDFSNSLKHPDYISNRTPLLYILHANFNPFLTTIDSYRLSVFIISLLIPSLFFISIRKKFPNLDLSLSLLLASIVCLSPYVRTSAYWGLEENYGIISLLLSFIFFQKFFEINEPEDSKKYFNLFLLTFFSSCCLYFDYKLFIIPLICFIKIIFSNVRYKFKVLSVIFYTLFSIPFFSLLFLWGDIFPPTVQPIHHVGSILFLNHPGFAISIIAFYLAPILFFKKQKISYLFQNIFINRNYQYLIALAVIYILFLFFIYEVPIVGFHQDIGKGYMYKISLILFDELWVRKIFISISILICWLVILAFLNSKILDWLVILYLLLASISIYPILQEYFDPVIFLLVFTFFNTKLEINYKPTLILYVYMLTLLVSANIYY